MKAELINGSIMRIDKRQAQVAYKNDLTVFIVPCNCSPEMHRFVINTKRYDHSFNEIVSLFTKNYCVCRKTGRYAAYYIPVKKVDRFTGEAPTPETLGAVYVYDDNHDWLREVRK